MNHSDPYLITADRTFARHALLAYDPAWRQLKAQFWRSLLDIIADWALIFLSASATYRIGWPLVPFALVVIGNRQRALGNLLHEASHGNLSKRRQINDLLAHLLLAPPLLNSLRIYRELHTRHHAWLGDPLRDPDFLQPGTLEGDRWFHAFIRCLVTSAIFRGALIGHLADKNTSVRQQLGILTWWIVASAALAIINPHFAVVFVALWFSSRITVFHGITTFREMTDHYGLTSGGIFSFTREIPDHGLLSILLHPHHNGYHLTHHLFPSVPYHQLPRLHARLMETDEYRANAYVCPAYLGGSPSGVAGWGAHHG
jgi:fatty acid desaturase